jgi:hypothetical protein
MGGIALVFAFSIVQNQIGGKGIDVRKPSSGEVSAARKTAPGKTRTIIPKRPWRLAVDSTDRRVRAFERSGGSNGNFRKEGCKA